MFDDVEHRHIWDSAKRPLSPTGEGFCLEFASRTFPSTLWRMLKLYNQTFGQQNTLLNIRRLPARLNVDHVAALLGCRPHDVPVLVKQKILTPLGKAPPNAVKYFATCELEQLSLDVKWLDSVTKALNTFWRDQNLGKKLNAEEVAGLQVNGDA
jgi:hypothetical protein